MVAESLHTIGARLIQKDIYKDGQDIKSLYKDPVFMKKINSEQYLAARNPLLMAFIDGCVNFRYNEANSTVLLFAYAVTIEMVYYLRNLNLVLPHCFLINLLQSFTSGSKTVSMLNGKMSAGASYPTYKRWLARIGQFSVPVPNTAVYTFFDNLGKYIRKSYSVKATKLKRANIITCVLHFMVGDISIQRSPSTPSAWKQSTPISQRQAIMLTMINQANSLFRGIRCNYVKTILAIVQNEADDVTMQVKSNNMAGRQCLNCFKEFRGSKRKCDSCNGQVVAVSPQDVAYVEGKEWPKEKSFQLGQTSKLNESKMKVGEPLMHNPNSYETVRKVLSEMAGSHGIGAERSWAFLGCDGPPYVLASRIIEENETEFGWAAMLPGLGHLHMNQLKTLFKVVDQIFLEPLGKEVLNFTTPKAYQYFRDAKDTHKSFQSLEIMLHGTTCELMHEYVGTTASPTANGFINWVSSHENETVGLMGELILTHALAVYTMKIGVRNNDAAMIDAGRMKFMPMFYGFHHPIYQELEYRDLENRATYPENVALLANKNMAFSKLLEENHQGCDFCLEGEIKRHKMVA